MWKPKQFWSNCSIHNTKRRLNLVKHQYSQMLYKIQHLIFVCGCGHMTTGEFLYQKYTI